MYGRSFVWVFDFQRKNFRGHVSNMKTKCVCLRFVPCGNNSDIVIARSPTTSRFSMRSIVYRWKSLFFITHCYYRTSKRPPRPYSFVRMYTRTVNTHSKLSCANLLVKTYRIFCQKHTLEERSSTGGDGVVLRGDELDLDEGKWWE